MKNNIISRKELIELYINKKNSCDKIGKIKKCSFVTIYNYLKKYNIKIRNRNETKTIEYLHPNITKEVMINIYSIEKLPQYIISDIFNISLPTLRKIIKYYNIKKKKKIKKIRIGKKRKYKRVKNKKNRNIFGVKYWRGRKLIYNPEHHRSNQKYVFNYNLVIEKKLGRKLKRNEIVHHIDGDHTNDSPDNLAAMTLREHGKIHHKKGKIKTKKENK